MMTHKQFEEHMKPLLRVALAIALRMRTEYSLRMLQEKWPNTIWREMRRADMQTGAHPLVPTDDYRN
jgi:hypothetical protein